MSAARLTIATLLVSLLATAAAAPGLVAQEAAQRLSLEHYLEMESAGNPQISPDGSTIVYTRGWIDKVNDRRESSLWTMGSDGADGTVWELGPPTAGPGAANSGDNCVATNLNGDYAISAHVWLRSPPIDLTAASEATLHYAQFVDIEEGFDFGSVRVLEAGDHSELAVIEDLVDGVGTAWEPVKKSIPDEGLGKVIVIEFRLESDDLENFFGWAIDDVELITPAP